MSSLALNMLTFSLDIILSGNEFQSLMAAIVKKFCLAVVLVFLVKILYGFPRVSLSLIVNSHFRCCGIVHSIQNFEDFYHSSALPSILQRWQFQSFQSFRVTKFLFATSLVARR